MLVDADAQWKYHGIKLTRGIGHPLLRRLCLMSLVAYLAGERHTSRPRASSPLIRRFAICLNDAAPARWRNELKSFAPRIIGTNDNREARRAAILFRRMREEVLQRACTDLAGLDDDKIVAPSALLLGVCASPTETIFELKAEITNRFKAEDYPAVGFYAGSLVAFMLSNAFEKDSRRWYWEVALDTLDQLCGDLSPSRERSIIKQRDLETLG